MSKIIDIGVDAAYKAGNFLRLNAGKIKNISVKQDNSLVTDLDKKAEDIIVDSIKSSFPDHAILAEECGNIPSSSDYTWIIDPIDGTHNYIRGIPLYGVSIGVVFKEKFIAGIIYIPENDEMYFSEKGKGAFKNNKPIDVSGISDIGKCTLAYDSRFKDDSEMMTKILADLGQKVFNIRMFGASTVPLTLLSEGKIDVVIEFDDKPWDFAAAVSIITEAGGAFTDLYGKPVGYKTKGYIASNNKIHKEALSTVNKYLKI